MASNSFGEIFRFSSFGESHGPAIGVLIDGIPAGIPLPLEVFSLALKKRRPGNTKGTSSRKEPDIPIILSGIQNGFSTGAPIAITIENIDADPSAYPENMPFRPGHADYTWFKKYKGHAHRSGGGRASGRETAARVLAGCVAKQWLLQHFPVSITSNLIRVGELENPSQAELDSYLEKIAAQKDSVGGEVKLLIKGVPAGIGEPIYQKLDARIAFALMSIGGVKSVSIGAGMEAASAVGSQFNDALDSNGLVTNHCGGILGGVSTGNEIIVSAICKPTPSIGLPQDSITCDGKPACLELKGRHDTCIALRASIVMEAMIYCVLADLHMMANS